MSWRLDDGEMWHAIEPETFELPTAAERENLVEGQFAKLIFIGSDQDGVERGERMWVLITEVTESGYVGNLNNDPFWLEGIEDGDRVEFEARHVIQVLD